MAPNPPNPDRPLLRALIVEDSEFDALILVNHLRQGGWRVESKRVATAEAFSQELQIGNWDLVLCDHFMPGFSAPQALVLYKQSGQDMPFIIVSGGIEEGVAIEAWPKPPYARASCATDQSGKTRPTESCSSIWKGSSASAIRP